MMRWFYHLVGVFYCRAQLPQNFVTLSMIGGHEKRQRGEFDFAIDQGECFGDIHAPPHPRAHLRDEGVVHYCVAIWRVPMLARPTLAL